MGGSHEHRPQAVLSAPDRHGRRAPRGERSRLNRLTGVLALLLFALAPWIPGCPEKTGAEELLGARELVSVEAPRRAMREIAKAGSFDSTMRAVADEAASRVLPGALLGVVLAGAALVVAPRFARYAAALGAGSVLTLVWIPIGVTMLQVDGESSAGRIIAVLALCSIPLALTASALARLAAGRGHFLARALAIGAVALSPVSVLLWGVNAELLLLGSALWLEVAPGPPKRVRQSATSALSLGRWAPRPVVCGAGARRS